MKEQDLTGVANLVKRVDRDGLQGAVGVASCAHLRLGYSKPTVEARRIELVLPNKPKSRSQRYRMTALAKDL